MEIFNIFDALCHGFSPGLIRSELCCASLLSAYHKLKDVVFWLALIVFAIHSYSLQGIDCLTRTETVLNLIARYICLLHINLFV